MSYFSINRVVLVGRLTRDPELRALPSGSSVCGLRIACNSSRKDAASGDYVTRPNYFDVSVFGASAESVSHYMRRGSRVAIDGRLEWREWETGEERRQAVSVVADTVQFLDRPGEGSRAEDGDGSDGGEQAAAREDGELVGVGAGVEDDDLF